MIRIAIVDDDIISLNHCKKIIVGAKIPNVWIDTYKRSLEFYELLFDKHEHFDIIILDIDMPDIDGFEIAKKIYELEIGCIVIFYTAHSQYVYQAYEYQPFRYIRKNYAEKELPYALINAVNKLEKQREHFISLQIDIDTIMVECSKIVYIETNGRRADIFLNDSRIINVRKTIKELMDLVDEESFFQVYSGAIVNLKYVEEYNSKIILLKTGEKISISRRKYTEFKEKMIEYLRCHE